LSREQRGIWESTTEGLNLAAKIEMHFRENLDDLRKCWWWRREKKAQLNPSYASSAADSVRPRVVYEDFLPDWRRSVRGNHQEVMLDQNISRMIMMANDPNLADDKRKALEETIRIFGPSWQKS
jgi:hypothetical protein